MSEGGTASRRRRGPSGSDSEYDEHAESNNGAIVTENAEGDESSEYTDQTESEGGERDPADGESPTEEHLDDDEDVKNPAFIPSHVKVTKKRGRPSKKDSSPATQNCFTDGCVEALVREVAIRAKRAHRKSLVTKMYKDVAEELTQLGFKVTPDGCRKKYNKLMDRYKKVSANNAKPDREPMVFKFEKLFNDVIGKRESNAPIKVAAHGDAKGAFYEHDSRAALEGEGKEKTAEETERPRKNLWKEKEKWAHDCFDEKDQAPKSREELVRLYGFDIRTKNAPPDDPPTTYSESRGYGRGRGNRRRGRKSFGEYVPGPRSQRGQHRGRRQYNRNPRRGGYGRNYDSRSDERPSQDVRSSDGGPEDTRLSDRESQDVRSQEEPVEESRPVEKPKPKMKSQDVRTELAEEQRQVTGQPSSDRQAANQAEQTANQKSSRVHKPGDRGDGPSKSANVNREEGRPKRYSAQRQNVGTAAPQKYPHPPPNAPPLVAGQPFIASAPNAIAAPTHQQIPTPVMAAVPRQAIPGAMALTQTTPPMAGVAPLMQAGSAYVMPSQPLPAQGLASMPAHGITPTGQVMAAPAPNLPPTQFQPQVAAISPQVAQTAPVVSEPGLNIGGAVYYQSPAEGTTYYPAQVPTTSNDLNTYFSSTSQTSGTPPSGGSQGVVFYDTQGQPAGQSKPRVRNVIAIVKPEASRVEGEGQHTASSQSTNEQTADHPPPRTDNSQTELSHVDADKSNSNEVKTNPISVSEKMPIASDSVEQSSDPVTPADQATTSVDTPAPVEEKSVSSPQPCDGTQSVQPSVDCQSAMDKANAAEMDKTSAAEMDKTNAAEMDKTNAAKTAATEIDSDSGEHFADAEEELAGGDKQLPVKVPTSTPSEQGDATPQAHTDTEV